jgi:hypothetical protein
VGGGWRADSAPRFSRTVRHGVRLQPTRPCSTVPVASCNSDICVTRSTIQGSQCILVRCYIRWDELENARDYFEDRDESGKDNNNNNNNKNQRKSSSLPEFS